MSRSVYRDDIVGLQHRAQELEAAIAQIDLQLDTLGDIERQRRQLRVELDQVHRAMATPPTRFVAGLVYALLATLALSCALTWTIMVRARRVGQPLPHRV